MAKEGNCHKTSGGPKGPGLTVGQLCRGIYNLIMCTTQPNTQSKL